MYSKYKSKATLALPRNPEIVNLKKLLLSGFSCVNTRIGYNNEILPLNVTSFSKLSIDLRFKQENGEI